MPFDAFNGVQKYIYTQVLVKIKAWRHLCTNRAVQTP
jgi:hypothetical protein